MVKAHVVASVAKDIAPGKRPWINQAYRSFVTRQYGEIVLQAYYRALFPSPARESHHNATMMQIKCCADTKLYGLV